ncbi:hypothetical protein ON010_g77 [Phytophthora cinnamomi]|nr:hypothetical protein ON010_g77 [Phytophthora cinnamomi]
MRIGAAWCCAVYVCWMFIRHVARGPPLDMSGEALPRRRFELFYYLLTGQLLPRQGVEKSVAEDEEKMAALVDPITSNADEKEDVPPTQVEKDHFHAFLSPMPASSAKKLSVVDEGLGCLMGRGNVPIKWYFAIVREGLPASSRGCVSKVSRTQSSHTCAHYTAAPALHLEAAVEELQRKCHQFLAIAQLSTYQPAHRRNSATISMRSFNGGGVCAYGLNGQAGFLFERSQNALRQRRFDRARGFMSPALKRSRDQDSDSSDDLVSFLRDRRLLLQIEKCKMVISSGAHR